MNESTKLYRAAARLNDVSFSPVRKVLERAKEIEKQGKNVVHFQIGEPDCNTPRSIIDATIASLNANATHYAPNRGTLGLRKSICQKMKSKQGLEYDPDTEVLVTVGGAEAINDAVLAFVDPGDEVIVFTPAFMNYRNVVAMAGGRTVPIALSSRNSFQIDPEELEKCVTAKTRMIILNNPSNPLGVVFSDESLEAVCAAARKHDLLVFSDEIYDEITYDGVRCRSIASFPGMKERTITMNGFSKTYAMTGWRLGFVAADARLVTSMLKVHQYATTCAPTFIQEGVAKAMLTPECDADVRSMVTVFERKRNRLMDGLRKIPKVSFVVPQGAFYLFLDVSATGLSGEEFARRLLEEKYVAVVPGVGFDEKSVGFVRISFAASIESIDAGLERIADFIDHL